MLFLTCDYKEDPKYPPTEFVLNIERDRWHAIQIADYPSITDAYNAMIQYIRENYREFPVFESSVISYLFMDGILVEGGRPYQTPECKTWREVK